MANNFFKNFLKLTIFTTFCLIALGGAVRAMNAGLACPDWPLCFNKVIPQYQIHVYYEFIHRAIAGIVALMTLFINIKIFKGSYPWVIKRTVILCDVVLLTQIILGGLTVLKLLHFSVVTAHLAFGIGFLCCLLWLYFQLFVKEDALVATPKSFHAVLILVAVILYTQIILGGLVSTNYAGLACGETFPLCNGELVPTLAGFVGIHVKHRLWGYLTAIAIFSFTHVIWKNRNQPWVSKKILTLGYWLSILIVIQICVGVVNVMYKIPPIVTVVHLALAAVLMGIMLKILYLGTRKTV